MLSTCQRPLEIDIVCLAVLPGCLWWVGFRLSTANSLFPGTVFVKNSYFTNKLVFITNFNSFARDFGKCHIDPRFWKKNSTCFWTYEVTIGSNPFLMASQNYHQSAWSSALPRRLKLPELTMRLLYSPKVFSAIDQKGIRSEPCRSKFLKGTFFCIILHF